MPTVVRMPEVLANTGEAVIQTWLVSVGQEVAIGDPLAEIETEKAVVEFTSEVEGVLAKLLVEPGVAIAVGDPIAVVLASGETDDDIDSVPVGAAEGGGDLEMAAIEMSAATVTTNGVDPPNPRRLFATPLVRKLARERGVDLESLTGTGPGGRIVRRDLDSIAAQAKPSDVQVAKAVSAEAPTASETAASRGGVAVGTSYVDVPLTGMRRAIARRLTESKSTVPHFYVTADCRVDALVDLRRSVNQVGTVKVSLNDFVLKAVAGALIEVPEANAIWNGDSIRRFEGADVAVAVAVDGGLLTPVLSGVEKMPLSAVASRVADLAQRAREGRLKQSDLEGGSFSVSNLGMYGVAEFSAILNPPQSGILAVGGAVQRPVVVDGELAVATVMTVTLSADHRVIDGSVAAEWMAAFTKRIENPLAILI